MTHAVTIEDIRKSFGTTRAVDGVSFDIANNEFVALLGASGCGKTTLLRLIAGLEQPDQGRILIAGQDVTSLPPYRRPVNLMFQSYALFPHMTVRGNVAFGLRQDGLRGAALEQRINEVLDLVELGGLGARKPDQLSGGQRQRVALARCIAKRPQVLLLDEPLAALDRALRERTRLELMSLRRRLGIAFVIVTHDQEDAMTMADRVAVMDAGKIVQVAPPRELYDAPLNRMVAGFFGEANIWEGHVAACGTRVACSMLGLDVAVMASLPPSGTKVNVAVRPERLELVGDTSAAENVIDGGTIEDIVYLGTVSTYLVRLRSGAVVRITRQNAQPLNLARGSSVRMSWPAAASIVLAS